MLRPYNIGNLKCLTFTLPILIFVTFPSSVPTSSSAPSSKEEFAPTVFQSSPYLENYRRFFGHGKTFHALEADGARAWLMTRGRTLKRLEWWGAGIHDIGAASSTGNGSDVDNSARLWSEIEALSARHDMTQLAQIAADAPLVECARAANWVVSPAEKCPLLTLPASWDEYAASLSKNMREQIKRYPKKLEREFPVTYHLAQNGAELESGLDDLFRLHGKRWRARGQTGVLVLPRRQKFQRALCHDFLQRDWLRLWTLKCDGRAVSVLLFYFYNGRLSYFIGGFDPEMGKWSVGTCLFTRVIQSAIDEGAQDIDFLKGEESYKYRLGATDREYVTLEQFQTGARGRLMQSRVALEKSLMHRLHQRFSAAHAKDSPKSSTRKQNKNEQ